MNSLVVKRAKNGKGIFTTRNFSLGETLFQIEGKFVTGYVDDDLGEEERSNTFRFSRGKYLNPKGTLSDFLNHSCKPNAKVVKKQSQLFLVAIEGIKRGSEVFMDYSTIIAPDDTWEMKCQCGEEECRKVISQFRKLPRKLKTQYVALGMVPSYILS